MTESERGHIRDIEGSIEELLKAVRGLRLEPNIQELIKFIKQPGWTTPAEAILVRTSIEQITDVVRIVDRMGEGLVRGAREVGA